MSRCGISQLEIGIFRNGIFILSADDFHFTEEFRLESVSAQSTRDFVVIRICIKGAIYRKGCVLRVCWQCSVCSDVNSFVEIICLNCGTFPCSYRI